MTEREKFEAWAVDYAMKCRYRRMDNVTKTHPDDPDWYLTTWVDMAWRGWKARAELDKEKQNEQVGGV
jgi:hypothetical protein